MKKFLSLCLALLMMMSLATTAFAMAPIPGDGDKPAKPSAAIRDSANYELFIPKKYIMHTDNIGGVDTTNAAMKPTEDLKFEANLIEAISPEGAKYKTLRCSVDSRGGYDSVIGVNVSIPDNFGAPGKYNYKITEVAPEPATQGVTYDKQGVYVQVFVYYENGVLMKQVTFTQPADTEQPEASTLKKGAFRNIYQLDGDGGVVPPAPTPNPDPTDPEIPDVNLYGPLSVRKTVAGKMGNQSCKFDIYVTLYSQLPVRSRITYTLGEPIERVSGEIQQIAEDDLPADGKWYQNSDTGATDKAYMAKVKLTLSNNQKIQFENIPNGVTYKVQEDGRHIGKFSDENVNVADLGYTVSYFNGKLEGNAANPTKDNPGDYGMGSYVTGTIGGDTRNNIRIENRKGDNNEDVDVAKPNTGIILDSVPYIMILTFVVVCTAFIFVGKRKRTED